MGIMRRKVQIRFKILGLSVLSKRCGSTVVMSLIAVVLIAIVGMGLLSLSLNSQIFAARNASTISARCAADAGLTKSIFEINNRLKAGPQEISAAFQAVELNDEPVVFLNTYEMLPNCRSSFRYKVAPSSIYTTLGNVSMTIESTGISGLAQKTVYANVKLQGPFEYAILTEDGLVLYSGSVVDWYNYGADIGNFKIGTQSTEEDAIELKDTSIINGDVIVGIGGDPDVVIKDLGATITGDSYPMIEEPYIPSIKVPDWLNALPSGGTIKNNTTITDSAKHDEIDLNNNNEIEIRNNVTLYVVGDVILGNSAEIIIDDSVDSSLVLYVGGNIEGKNGSAFNNKTQDPKKLKIYGLNSCHEMRFKNSCDFYGVIYAPKADVTFDNSADAYGSIVARTFEQKNSGVFNYDASLREVGLDDEAIRFVVSQWRE